MKSKLLLFGLLAGIIALNPVISNSASAEEKEGKVPSKTVKKAVNEFSDRMQKSRGAGTGEPVSNKLMLNDPKDAKMAPPEKGGAKTRGEDYCRFNVDNRTNAKVIIIVDDEELGLVPAWGDTSVSYGPGAHIIKGLVYNTDGSSSSFGPRKITKCSGPLKWSLLP